jgi:hypothetical protein
MSMILCYDLSVIYGLSIIFAHPHDFESGLARIKKIPL